jgi:hypothetical protein
MVEKRAQKCQKKFGKTEQRPLTSFSRDNSNVRKAILNGIEAVLFLDGMSKTCQQLARATSTTQATQNTSRVSSCEW